MSENINVQNLLTYSKLIIDKYTEISKMTGENYNIFNIVGITSDELAHSSVISNLLNSKGTHGQGDKFLKLFIETIQESLGRKTVINLDPHNSTSKKEVHIGSVNHNDQTGGYIDILISDRPNKNHIIIENKIYAKDQYLQLVRYNNQYENKLLLYLTRFSSKPSKESCEYLINDKDYFCISYKSEIKKWIEKCIKESFNLPLIRETLKQYLTIINNFTNQSNNLKMNEEISNLILLNENNFQSYIDLIKSEDSVRKNVYGDIFNAIERISLLKELKYFYSRDKLTTMRFQNEKMDLLEIEISFGFGNSDNKTGFFFGFRWKNAPLKNEEILQKTKKDSLIKIKNNFKEIYNLRDDDNYYLARQNYNQYKDWDLITLKDMKFGDFIKDFEDKIDKMLKIVESI